MREIHVANLTNGVLCAPADATYLRIQSTWCEQKRWEDLLWAMPADLLVNLALGHKVIVHDQSEQQRATRAQWQGLSWIRYALRAAWDLPEGREKSRSNMDVTHYWWQQWRDLDFPVRRHLNYYKAFDPTQVDLVPCECARVAAPKIDLLAFAA